LIRTALLGVTLRKA